MKYRPEINGLRAVAVVPVIFYHAGLTIFKGGYVGVDVFFVISGYLICTNIMTLLDSGKFNIVDFYERRARRILPALFFVILITTPFALAWMLPNERSDFAYSIAGVATFLSNFVFWKQSGYFEASAAAKPLLHTWSLAVEEQFYLLFPLLLMGVWRYSKKRFRAAVAVILAIASFSLLISELGWRFEPNANFYLPFSRAWELLAGCGAALYHYRFGAKPSEIGGAIGLTMVMIAVFVFSDAIPVPSLYALLPVAGAAMVILWSAPQTWVGRLLGSKPLVGIGLISYSAYLWHQPLMALLRIRMIDPPAPWMLGATGVISIVVAYFTWRYVEEPFRRRENRLLPSQFGVLVASVAGLCLLMLGFLAIRQTASDVGSEMTFGNCNYNNSRCFDVKDPQFVVAVWGDSIADEFTAALGRLLNENNISLEVFVKHSCPSLVDTLRDDVARFGSHFQSSCKKHNDEAIEAIGSIKPRYVVIASAYRGWLEDRDFSGKQILLDAQNPLAPTSSFIPERLADTVKWIDSIGSKAVWVESQPDLTPQDFEAQRKRFARGLASDIHADVAANSRLTEKLSLAMKEQGAATLSVDPISVVCRVLTAEICSITNLDGSLRLSDGVHVSAREAPELAEKILNTMTASDGKAL